MANHAPPVDADSHDADNHDDYNHDDDPAAVDLPTLDRTTRAEMTHAAHERLRVGDTSTTAGLGPRDELILLNMPVADAIAARYRNRGVPLEDLSQVAYLALVKAAHRFDEESGHDFLSYAVPTIRGEVMRHFRDHGWTIRPPRRIQELQSRISAAEEELSTKAGRAPSRREVALHLGEPTAAIDDARAASGCFAPTSLDRPATEGSVPITDLIGAEEPGYAAAEARVLLTRAIQRLSARDRRALMLRYYRGCTQSEIGEGLGLTQAQVSRLLSRVLADLRAALSGTLTGPGSCHPAEG